MLQNSGFNTLDRFFTGLTDSPYLPWLPAFVQHLIFKIPVALFFELGMRFPRRYSDNIVILAQKV
jgi:hypothetical protein